MEPTSTYRPRVSRETRRLLATGVLAVAALWLLARIRFEEHPVTPNPVPAMFGQLAAGAGYDELADAIARVRNRLDSSIVAVPLPAAPGTGVTSAAALRFRGDLVVTWQPAAAPSGLAADPGLLVHDGATGLAVMRVSGWAPESVPLPWVPRRAQQPRYLLSTDVSPGGVSLAPVYVGALDAVDSAVWAGPIWVAPAGSGLVPGAFVFTSNSELAGLVVEHGSGRAIVPGPTVLALAERLLAQPHRVAATIGVEVQPLTPPLAALTGAAAGVVVTWVETPGAAAGSLAVGDAIEAVDGGAIGTRQDWESRMARLRPGDALRLRLRRRGEVRDVTATAVATTVSAGPRILGLALQRRTDSGSEVTGVTPGSAADRAGLVAGDLITHVADVAAPTPAQITRAFAAAAEGQRLMVAVTRAGGHHVLVLER